MAVDRLVIGAAVLVAVAGPAAAACTALPQPPAAATVRAIGELDAAWERYKRRHIAPDGRVIDGANGGISHSEGQGYALLLAAKLADRDTFDRVLGWTMRNLAVREDRLFAWRWSPGETPPVTDRNNATDGDILIAWALMEAAAFWEDAAYRITAEAIAADVARLAVAPSPVGPLLMPAAAGFDAGSREDGPVVNLSYYVFPAEAALGEAAPEAPWAEIFAVGRRLLDTRNEALPTEWSSVGPDGAEPAAGFDPVFGYNAIRIPLYAAWAACDEALLSRFRELWPDAADPVRIVDVSTGIAGEPLAEPGYQAVPELVACALAPAGVGGPVALGPSGQNYYPETLQILARIAQLELYPWCSA